MNAVVPGLVTDYQVPAKKPAIFVINLHMSDWLCLCEGMITGAISFRGGQIPLVGFFGERWAIRFSDT